MRLNRSIIAATLVALAAGPAIGQATVKKLEGTLQAPAPAAGAPAARTPATGAPAAGTGAAATPVPGYLGANVDDTPEVGKGVLVTGVKKGAPSELGGLKEGDVIVAIDGKLCRNLDDLDGVLAKGTVGTKLNFQIERAGKLETQDHHAGSSADRSRTGRRTARGNDRSRDSPSNCAAFAAAHWCGRQSRGPSVPRSSRDAADAEAGCGSIQPGCRSARPACRSALEPDARSSS